MKSYLIYIYLIFSALLFVSCNQANTEKPENQNNENQKPTYNITTLKSDTLNYELTLPGDLKPYDQATLYAKVEGFVSKLNVDLGDEVKKGEVLAVIEAPEIEQKYLSAKSKEREILEKFSFSSQNYKYLEKAAKVDGAVSAIEVEQARSRFMADSAAWSAVKAEVSAAEHLAKYREITAPFDGIITDRLVSLGALVGGEKQALFNLSREDKLRLSVAIPSKHANALQPKTKASFMVNAYPNKKFPVELTRSSKALNPELRASIVEYDVDNIENLLHAGDYAEVSISMQKNLSSIQVPTSSIIETKNNIYIAKVTDEKVQMIPIVTGLTHQNKIEIFGDIQEGDQIIINANSSLKEGLEITPVFE